MDVDIDVVIFIIIIEHCDIHIQWYYLGFDVNTIAHTRKPAQLR